MKTLILFLSLQLFLSSLSVAQYRVIKVDSVSIFEINNCDFKTILDSFIIHEHQYEYFNKNVTMFMNVLDTTGTCLQLSSGSVIDSLFIMNYDLPEDCGIFYYYSIRFLFKGRSLIDDRILKKSVKKIAVYSIEYYENSTAIEDDRYFPTSWIYVFSNGRFYSTWKSDMKRIE